LIEYGKKVYLFLKNPPPFPKILSLEERALVKTLYQYSAILDTIADVM